MRGSARLIAAVVVASAAFMTYALLALLVPVEVWAAPSALTFSQSADKLTMTLTWTTSGVAETASSWDVTSDRPNFGHLVKAQSGCGASTCSVSWTTDSTYCGTGWKWTVTGYTGSGASGSTTASASAVYAPTCPASVTANAIPVVVQSLPAVAVTNTPAVAVPSPLAVHEVSPAPAASVTASLACGPSQSSPAPSPSPSPSSTSSSSPSSSPSPCAVVLDDSQWQPALFAAGGMLFLTSAGFVASWRVSRRAA